jgi:Holliday junction resolvase
MASIKEKELWAAIKNAVSKEASIHAFRVENTACPGTPDVLICYDGIYSMIELKVVEKGKLHFRPAQINWAINHIKAGGNYWAIFKSEEGVHAINFKNIKINEAFTTNSKYYVMNDFKKYIDIEFLDKTRNALLLIIHYIYKINKS